MAADFVGGAFLGAVFGELLKIVTDAIRETYMFKPELEDLKSTLESITPILQEIEKLNGVLNIPGRETAKLRKEIIEGAKLVHEISKVKRFIFFHKVNYADKIIQLKKSIETFCNVNLQTQMARDNKRILLAVDSMVKMLRKNENGVGVSHRVEIDGPCSVPDPPVSTPGLDVPMKELRTELLKDDGMQVIVVSAPGGAGKTTLIKKLCKDDQVKDKFQENILFVTVSKIPDVKFIIQRIFQHKKKEVLAFQTEEAAINDFKRLLKSIGQPVLLVLDDVWSESVVQKFKFKLSNYKILVTSRSVFPQFGILYQLKPLNDEAAMILFRSSVTIEGAGIPLPSPPIPQVPAKPESLPMKCQWQKGRLIGRGIFGSVYVGSNRETGALCAMKEVKIVPDDPKSAEYIKQLEQEIKVLSNLKHPNIVQYYGSEIVEDKFYIYMEYVHPGSINRYVRDDCGAITESIVRNFTRHILSGLAYLHSKKTIHRDIKGANLLVGASGVVKLADFGMAEHLTGEAAYLSLKGSPYWMAPELMIPVMQRDNNSDLALAVDIWSLGCTIIEMFTGKPPWSEFEGPTAMFKVINETPSIPERLSAEGKDFLRCCFQRNPADRPLASKLLEHRFLKYL